MRSAEPGASPPRSTNDPIVAATAVPATRGPANPQTPTMAIAARRERARGDAAGGQRPGVVAPHTRPR